MSKLGSLYIRLGEPEGELCGGTCEIDDWAADEIERLRAELEVLRNQEPVAILGFDLDEWRAFLDALRPYPSGTKLYLAAGAQPAPDVKEGWKLVPVEPTDEMLIDIRDKHWKTSGSQLCKVDYQRLYAAMLAAAPETAKLPPKPAPIPAGAAQDLLAACKEFVRKVEAGEARSVRSYAQMKAAITKAENVQPAPIQEVYDWPEGATHYQPQQKAFYKRVSACEWYVWSRITDEPLHWSYSPGTMDSAEWIVRAQPALSVPGRATMIERLKAAVEGECDGLAVDDRHAEAILDYVFAAAPEAPKRKTLTDEQIQEIWNVKSGSLPAWSRHIAFARAVEAAHGIKENSND